VKLNEQEADELAALVASLGISRHLPARESGWFDAYQLAEQLDGRAPDNRLRNRLTRAVTAGELETRLVYDRARRAMVRVYRRVQKN
jgi:hypothetical protein